MFSFSCVPKLKQLPPPPTIQAVLLAGEKALPWLWTMTHSVPHRLYTDMAGHSLTSLPCYIVTVSRPMSMQRALLLARSTAMSAGPHWGASWETPPSDSSCTRRAPHEPDP